jgi:UDP:flavonoid glycosyltransferase YjiC (YdhE family)
MRVLFTFMGGNGHFVPLIPVARAAEAAGHTITFGCGPSMVSTVKTAGFPVFQLGTGVGQPPGRLPLRPLDSAREDQEFRDRFARKGAQSRAPHIIALCAEWKPELLVCEETDFGSMLAAEYLGLPYATVLVMAAGSFVRSEVIGGALNELRSKYTLPFDPELEMLHRFLVLSPFPRSLRDPAYPLPVTAHAFRPFKPEGNKSQAPAWLLARSSAPVVYFTLGTVFNLESGDLFTRVLAGLCDLPVNIMVTVGRDIDPKEFGPQPANVYIDRYITQDSILPFCSLVISHAGSGSVAGAVAYGRPMVLIPMGADQPLNAARCVELGVAQALDPMEATPESIRSAVSTVLAEPSYRIAAERIRDEFTELPGPEYSTLLLERLATEKRAILSKKA